MRLTSRNVRSLDPGEYRDPLVPGLILRVTDSSRAWGFRYTFAGKRCRVELGPLERDKDHVAENIEQTRNLARNLVSGIVRGEDPRIALNRHGTDALTVPQLCGKAIADLDLKPRTRGLAEPSQAEHREAIRRGAGRRPESIHGPPMGAEDSETGPLASVSLIERRPSKRGRIG